MNALKIVITFCAAIFITTGVLAHSNNDCSLETPIDSSFEESPQISTAQAVSLLSFIPIMEVKKDSTELKPGSGNVHFMDLIRTFF